MRVFTAQYQTAPIHLASLDFAEDAVDRKIEAIELVELFEYLGFRRQHRADVVAAFQVRAHLVLSHQVEQVRHRHGEDVGVAIDRQRQDAMASGEMLRQQGNGFRIGDRLRQFDAGLAGVVRQHVAQHGFADEAQADELAP